MKSMTGYGRGSTTGATYSVTVDLKTVNNRFLDIHLRSGTELSFLEMELRRRISARLSRGRVDVSIALDQTGEMVYEVNRPLIAGFIRAMKTIQHEFDLAGEVDINALVRLPGVLQPARNGLSEEVIEGVNRAIDEALADLERMRLLEGQALAVEMRGRLDEIERQASIIEGCADLQLETYRTRLQKRIADIIARDGQEAIELDQGRLAQEVAYLADRSDINEEIARLRSHLAQFRATLEEEGETGKKLDFILQELNREANTMLSKSTDITIKEAALAIKGEIEKLREQVQNVE